MVQFNFQGNDTPLYLSVIYAIENYGWYVLIASVIVFYLYRKYQTKLDEYWENKASQDYASYYHKNPDLLTERLTAREQYAQKLQEKYTNEAKVYQEKMEQKENKKKQEWLERHLSGGHRLGSSNENSLRPDYNPLMGDTSSRTYKAQRKTPCSGGGCKK
ncbi:hypothetical protein RN001_004991 [Aquatica leii]|uniref:Selenoprotein S n=1 Tax=Aquatica leii TaxID=1421715 RepID=A0AAN7SHQ0_9COLE|nr:hypothetical protein RN001_004991 [Aquatica leii]